VVLWPFGWIVDAVVWGDALQASAKAGRNHEHEQVLKRQHWKRQWFYLRK